jgi:hypothetical protein
MLGMENIAGDVASTRNCVHAGLAPLVLPHLSEQCNDSEIALTSMCDAVARTSLQGAVTAASQGVRK